MNRIASLAAPHLGLALALALPLRRVLSRSLTSLTSLAIVTAPLAAGCAATSSDEPAAAEADSHLGASVANANPSWTSIVSCDGGAMTIEVNEKERRELRVVLHDRAIARYVAQGQYESTYQSNRCGADGSFASNPCIADDGALVLPGQTEDGVFSSSAFSWVRGTAQLFSGDRAVDYTAWRDGTGMRLERMSDSQQHFTCDYSGSGWCSPPESVPASKIVYADWRFRSCTDL